MKICLSSPLSRMSADNPFNLKIVLLGLTLHSGKTALITRYCRGYFDPNTLNTIGAAFMAVDTVVDGIDYHLETWGLLSLKH